MMINKCYGTYLAITDSSIGTVINDLQLIYVIFQKSIFESPIQIPVLVYSDHSIVSQQKIGEAQTLSLNKPNSILCCIVIYLLRKIYPIYYDVITLLQSFNLFALGYSGESIVTYIDAFIHFQKILMTQNYNSESLNTCLSLLLLLTQLLKSMKCRYIDPSTQDTY